MKHVKKHKDVIKTPSEIVLFEKYNPEFKNLNDPMHLHLLAIKFKEDLKVLFIKRKKYRCVLAVLLFTSLSFGQSGIVVAGNTQNNISYTIGAQLVELQIPIVEEVTLSTPKFEVPIEQPKIVKKKLTIFDKIINLIKKLFKK